VELALRGFFDKVTTVCHFLQQLFQGLGQSPDGGGTLPHPAEAGGKSITTASRWWKQNALSNPHAELPQPSGWVLGNC